MAAATKNANAEHLVGDGPCQSGLVTSQVATATGNFEFGVGANLSVVEATLVQTAGTAGQSITLSLEGFNPATSGWDTLITSAARTSATTDEVTVQVNPYTPPITNASAQRAVRRKMRVTVTHADSKSVTYSIELNASQ